MSKDLKKGLFSATDSALAAFMALKAASKPEVANSGYHRRIVLPREAPPLTKQYVDEEKWKMTPKYDMPLIKLDAKEHSFQFATPSSTNNNSMDLLSNIPGMNLSFGKLQTGLIALSLSGELAFKDKNGSYVTIQNEGGEKTRVDVGSLKFDIDFYKVPTQELEEGDVVLLDGDLLIAGKKTNGETKFINPLTGATTNKLQRSNILGVYFYTKVVSLFDMAGGQASGVGLGGLDPMMLMLMSQGGNSIGGSDNLGQLLVMSQLGGSGADTSKLLPLLLMSGGGGNSLNGSGGIGQLLMLQALSGKGGGSLFGKKAAAKPVTKVVAKKAVPAKKKVAVKG